MTVEKTEPAEHSCKSIVEFMRKDYGSKTMDVRRVLLEDLLFKARQVGTSDKAVFFAQGMYYALPDPVRASFTEQNLGLETLHSLTAKQAIDVGIITVRKPELDAVIEVFGGSGGSRFQNSTFRYWFTELERFDGSTLTIVISHVGQARNVPCAIAVDQLLSRFSPKLLMLVGMAGGPKSKVKLGDIVFAKQVYDYEHVRAEISEGRKIEKQRPLYIPAPQSVRQDLERYDHTHTQDRVRLAIGRLSPDKVPTKGLSPQFHPATIAAGERLFADGSLEELRNWDETIRAGDQEDSGFAQACDFQSIPWVVLRGIADYGDPQKTKDKDKGWQFTASLTAACAGHTFLERAYDPTYL